VAIVLFIHLTAKTSCSLIQIEKPENGQDFAPVASVEFDCFPESRWLFIQHRIPSGSSIATEVDGIQDREGTTDAEHAADKISR
jgi:hypothetical protein